MNSSSEATVAEAIRRHGARFIQTCNPSGPVRSLMGVLPLCRTAALGGHLYRCTNCGHQQPRYNSCGNRHCPNCQVKARERWLADQEAMLLELPYFHMVFTLPAELQPLILQNKRQGYNLLFKCAAETLMKFGRDPKHRLGGQLGFTAVLHTWTQTLGPHAHLHILIPAGALNKSKHAFVSAKKGKWLFPVKALSRVFRALFLKRLKAAHAKSEIKLYGQLEFLTEPAAFQSWLNPLYQKPWVVYAKRPFGGPKQVLQYLGRYTHRTGISNARIQAVTNQHVRFLCRDRNDPAKKKTMQLDGVEFLRRFFLHILPKGFTRIRHYGFLGNAVRKTNIPHIRILIGQSPPDEIKETPIERIARVYRIDLNHCPCCKTGELEQLRPLPLSHTRDPP